MRPQFDSQLNLYNYSDIIYRRDVSMRCDRTRERRCEGLSEKGITNLNRNLNKHIKTQQTSYEIKCVLANRIADNYRVIVVIINIKSYDIYKYLFL
jgi:hypothetical protein